MTRCARRILFAVVAAIALASFPAVAQAAPERTELKPTAHDLQYATRVVKAGLRRDCTRRVKNIRPDWIIFRCEPPSTDCHAGDNIPWSPTTVVCHGTYVAESEVAGFEPLFCEVTILLKKLLWGNKVVWKRLPWEGVTCSTRA